jgi:ubiquinone/menaquinone biosynthesis C-methylase UbiE
MTSEVSERSRRVAGVFDRSAATYDQVGVPWFGPIAQGLVAELAVQPGERVLDVGCGRGAATFLLAEATGPRGAVTAIDLAPGMVEALRADLAGRGLTQVIVHQMDAAAPGLASGSFDVLASSLVLFFLPDPAAALTAWHALLRPGGRIGISTFGPQDANWLAVEDVFTPYLPPQLLDARASGRKGPFASAAGVETLLTTAGFSAARTVTTELPVVFADEAQWHEWTWSHGQRAMWEAVPPEHHAGVRAEAARRLDAARDASGQITLTQQVRYTLATRP